MSGAWRPAGGQSHKAWEKQRFVHIRLQSIRFPLPPQLPSSVVLRLEGYLQRAPRPTCQALLGAGPRCRPASIPQLPEAASCWMSCSVCRGSGRVTAPLPAPPADGRSTWEQWRTGVTVQTRCAMFCPRLQLSSLSGITHPPTIHS